MVKKIEDMITRFDTIHECDRQQDGQTDTARRCRPIHSIALPKPATRSAAIVTSEAQRKCDCILNILLSGH